MNTNLLLKINLEAYLPYISWGLLGAMLLIILVGYIYIVRKRNTDKLLSQRRWIEMIPSAVSTLGVLGTFLGITLGLICFDTNDLNSSIPGLLEGLKTAFFTSLAGMIGSLVLSKKVNNLYDEATGGVSDINQAAGTICQSVANFQQVATQQAQNQQVFYNFMQVIVQQMDANIASMNANISSLNVAVNDVALKIDNVKNSVDSIDNSASSILSSVGNVEEASRNQNMLSQHIESRLGETLEHTEAMVSIESEVSERIGKLTDRLHGEVVEIEEKMEATNQLLTQKFDEFSELLKKSNTEALVEVMKQVTEEFQRQMNTLISKLVQENFAQLNKSVEQLNQWQQENKEMIASLTAQYKEMSTNFESTSTTLTRVKDDTDTLVGNGGKLRQIVDALNEVIVEDEKFIKISSDLQGVAELTKTNYEQFDASTKALNEWVKKQRNFVDSVNVLIQKLDDLNKIRDYGEEFWKETRKEMSKTVSTITQGAETLQAELASIDQQFYQRLNATLANLDACIQAVIDGKKK